LLPRWRGAAPVQRAILAGDRQTGISIMQMDEGLDTGDVLAQATLAIAERETTATLTQKLAALGPETLLNALAQIQAGTATPKPQSQTGVTYADKIGKDEAEIDWHKPVQEVDRQIRGFNPDPIAFSHLGALRVKIWQAAIQGETSTGAPGEIIACSRNGIDVACGQGTLRITRLQIPVGKGSLLSALDIMNGRRAEFTQGNRFS
jgi:methionyl-tRNA formyltransferase